MDFIQWFYDKNYDKAPFYYLTVENKVRNNMLYLT